MANFIPPANGKIISCQKICYLPTRFARRGISMSRILDFFFGFFFIFFFVVELNRHDLSWYHSNEYTRYISINIHLHGMLSVIQIPTVLHTSHSLCDLKELKNYSVLLTKVLKCI